MSYNVLSKQLTSTISASFTGSFAGAGSGLLDVTASFIAGGATGYITLWNSPNSLTSSLLFQSGSSITATTSDFFLINNTNTSLKVSSKGVEVTSSAQVPLQVNNASSQSLLQVSQSGVITVATQSSIPTGTTTAGNIWFTSASFYVSLEG
jgi:hypothetical protein